MSIAFCFLTLGDVSQPRLWDLFFREKGACGIFCHPKKPEAVTIEWLKNGIISELVETKHAHISLVAATLSLLRAAYDQSDHEHFVLLSETTIPTMPLGQIVSEAEAYTGKSLIQYDIPAHGSEHFIRQTKLPIGVSLTPFFSHPQWIVLARRHVRMLLEKPRLEWFATMFAPEEHYFLNVLAHQCGVGADEVLNLGKTFVNWREHEVKEVKRFDGKLLKRTIHPKTYHHITLEDVGKARDERMWFFRKVSSQCDCRALEAFISVG